MKKAVCLIVVFLTCVLTVSEPVFAQPSEHKCSRAAEAYLKEAEQYFAEQRKYVVTESHGGWVDNTAVKKSSLAAASAAAAQLYQICRELEGGKMLHKPDIKR